MVLPLRYVLVTPCDPGSLGEAIVPEFTSRPNFHVFAARSYQSTGKQPRPNTPVSPARQDALAINQDPECSPSSSEAPNTDFNAEQPFKAPNSSLDPYRWRLVESRFIDSDTPAVQEQPSSNTTEPVQRIYPGMHSQQAAIAKAQQEQRLAGTQPRQEKVDPEQIKIGNDGILSPGL